MRNNCRNLKKKKKKSIIKKKKKKHDEKVLLAKHNLDCIKGLISKSLIHISLWKLDLINGILRKHDYMKEEIDNPKNSEVN